MADIQELKKLNGMSAKKIIYKLLFILIVPGSSWAQVKPAFLKILGDSGALHHASKIKELEDKLNDKYPYENIIFIFFLYFFMTNITLLLMQRILKNSYKQENLKLYLGVLLLTLENS